MNNLTTRKIVLGLLMVLVLAFGVQGICEALTIIVQHVDISSSKTTGSSDLEIHQFEVRAPSSLR